MDGFIDKFAQRKNAQELIRANAMAEAEEREKMASQIVEYEAAMREMRRCNLLTLENAESVKELLEAGLNKIEEIQKKDEGDDRKSGEDLREVKDLLEGIKNRMAELLEGHKNQIAGLLEDQNGRTAEILEGQKKQIMEALEGQKDQISGVLADQRGQITEILESQKGQTAELLRDQGSLLERLNTDNEELMERQRKTLEELLHNTEDFTHKESVKVYRNVQAVIESGLPKQTEEITEAVKNEMKGKQISVGFKIVWVLTLAAALANVAIEVLRFLGIM